jgi:hypothetical protein
MKVHKTTAKQVDGFRWRQVLWCQKDRFHISFRVEYSRWWKNVTCLNCLRLKK